MCFLQLFLELGLPVLNPENIHLLLWISVSELCPRGLIHLLCQMMIAKNNEELWSAVRSLSERVLFFEHISLRRVGAAQRRPRESVSLWGLSGAFFIHSSAELSFTLFRRCKVEMLQWRRLPSPSLHPCAIRRWMRAHACSHTRARTQQAA